MRSLTNNKGFTLVEMLLAVLFGVIVMAGIGIAVQSVSRSGFSLERKVVAQQDVRAALEIMAMEIGMASYNPTFAASTMWLNVADCATAGTANNKGIQTAATNSMTVEMDIAGSGTDGDGVLDDNNEIITYTYDTANQRITRSTNCGNAFDILGCIDANNNNRCDTYNNNADNVPRGVRVVNDQNGNGIIDGAEVPVFRYYDAAGAVTASIPDIRRIEITLVVEIDETGFTYTTTGTQKRRLVYSTSVIPRNHPITY